MQLSDHTKYVFVMLVAQFFVVVVVDIYHNLKGYHHEIDIRTRGPDLEIKNNTN